VAWSTEELNPKSTELVTAAGFRLVSAVTLLRHHEGLDRLDLDGLDLDGPDSEEIRSTVARLRRRSDERGHLVELLHRAVLDLAAVLGAES
jgi:hypothetical protein